MGMGISLLTIVEWSMFLIDSMKAIIYERWNRKECGTPEEAGMTLQEIDLNLRE